jgi:hypothetical protein
VIWLAQVPACARPVAALRAAQTMSREDSRHIPLLLASGLCWPSSEICFVDFALKVLILRQCRCAVQGKACVVSGCTCQRMMVCPAVATITGGNSAGPPPTRTVLGGPRACRSTGGRLEIHRAEGPWEPHRWPLVSCGRRTTGWGGPPQGELVQQNRGFLDGGVRAGRSASGGSRGVNVPRSRGGHVCCTWREET